MFHAVDTELLAQAGVTRLMNLARRMRLPPSSEPRQASGPYRALGEGRDESALSLKESK